MLRWQGLDIHDLEAEEEAEAQRQEYKQRLKVETQEPLVSPTSAIVVDWRIIEASS